MSTHEVWALGVPASGFTEEDLLANARMLFPRATKAQIARFGSGQRFLVTKVGSPAVAGRIVATLRNAGVASEHVEGRIQPLTGVDLSELYQWPPAQAADSPRVQPVRPALSPTVPPRPPKPIPMANLPSRVRKVVREGESVLGITRVRSRGSLWWFLLGLLLVPAGVGCLILVALRLTRNRVGVALTDKRLILWRTLISPPVSLDLANIQEVHLHGSAPGSGRGRARIVLIAGSGDSHARLPLNLQHPELLHGALLRTCWALQSRPHPQAPRERPGRDATPAAGATSAVTPTPALQPSWPAAA